MSCVGGVGNAWWPGGSDPDPANPILGRQGALDDAASGILGLTTTGQYWIQGYEGLDSVTVVPDLTTMIAGGLLLLPFAGSTVRFLRKKRIA